MDIRNVDVAAAGAAGVLVTHASAGFTTAVAEWVLGAMLDLSRGISDSVLAYRAGQAPAIVMGRELRGATLGVIGYGQIGRRVCALGQALGMHVLACDPQLRVDAPASSSSNSARCWHGPTMWCAWRQRYPQPRT